MESVIVRRAQISDSQDSSDPSSLSSSMSPKAIALPVPFRSSLRVNCTPPLIRG